MKSLALEREYATGGWELGRKIAQSENLPFYDERAIIEEAGRLGYDLDLMQNYGTCDDESVLFSVAMIDRHKKDIQEQVGQRVSGLFEQLKDTVEQLQAKGSGVFVGLGVTDIMSGSDDFYRVYLKAGDKMDRIKKVRDRKPGASEDDIGKLLGRKDTQRRIYYQCVAKKEWSDTANYDAVYDISGRNPDAISQEILNAMRS